MPCQFNNHQKSRLPYFLDKMGEGRGWGHKNCIREVFRPSLDIPSAQKKQSQELTKKSNAFQEFKCAQIAEVKGASFHNAICTEPACFHSGTQMP